VIRIPFDGVEAASRRAELAAAYSSGPLLSVETVPLPAGDGVTVLLSGLSGSGKSTIARSLVERLVQTRTVTLLDGDVVRTHLSRGLGFSREDRDINVRRIGWVAGEVTKHGGMAVCAPISPYDETRRWMRSVVEAAGGPGSFLLVWVSTPIEVCEARDVKGLYAKARAGLITGFTGVDDPYEPPLDAELVIDTSEVSVSDAVESILAALASR
jgi:sulfate adenylyltransferase